jgi:hypothetical protein
MAFCTRVFCREGTAPPLTEVLMWQRQHGTPVVVVGGASADDLMSPFWSEVELSYDPEEAPFRVLCHHVGDPVGAARLREEVNDFLEDLAELPEGEGGDDEARARVDAHLRDTRFVMVVEFPEGGVGPAGYQANGWLMSVFVERASGMVQCDGIGFYDENDEIILRIG